MVDRAVGSMVGEGTISALSYAWRIISLGQTLLVASLLTALYPAFGAAAGSRDLEEMRRLVGRGLSTVAAVLMPVWGFLMVCSVPRWRCSSSTAALPPAIPSARQPRCCGMHLPCWRSGGGSGVRASYALGDSRRPVTVLVMAMSINVVGDFTLGLTFGIAGIAASTSLSVLFLRSPTPGCWVGATTLLISGRCL